jgi:hypothetical protein
MSTKLFVGNLAFSVTENDLNDAFAAHGTVTESDLMMDRATSRSRGFGFVTMSTPVARPREEGSGARRSFGGGGGYRGAGRSRY